MTVVDLLDRKIAGLLQDDNRLTAAEIGHVVGLSVSAANERVRRLNGAGVIRGNHAVLDPERVGLPLCAFILVDLVPHADDAAFRAALAARPEIQEIHQVAGPHCYLLKLRTGDTRALQRCLADGIKRQADVLRTETVIVLETIKESVTLALAEAATDVAPVIGHDGGRGGA